MKQVKYEILGCIELAYDENTPEFKEALESYSTHIERGAGISQMLQHVAFYITRFGADVMVEGVGYIGKKGVNPTGTPGSGIWLLNDDYDDFQFEKIS